MGEYVDAGGVRTYYEVHGDGDPVLLLHGGFEGADSWGAQTPELSRHYRLVIPERRGHVHTPDVDGPITYENMAADTIAFMETVETGPAHLIGWSDGALVGLLVAMQRPALVRKLVLIGQYVNKDGEVPWFGQMAADLTVENCPPFLRDGYDRFSPDGSAHFPVVFEKMVELWRREPNIPLADLGRIQAPTLVLVGDTDVTTLEHAAAMYEALPDAQLAVVPGATHVAPIEKPELVNQLLLDFLADEQAPKLFTAAAVS
jgi:pimeloyl-ACP methyl ester carboxylesterase